MEGAEELRETIVGMRREIDALRMENTHANLLLQALDAVLCVTGDADPFANVFSALLPVFDASHAIVLVEDATPRDALHCVAANADVLVDSRWRGGRTFAKVLSGRVVTTVTGADWEEWPEGAAADVVSAARRAGAARTADDPARGRTHGIRSGTRDAGPQVLGAGFTRPGSQAGEPDGSRESSVEAPHRTTRGQPGGTDLPGQP